MTGKTNIAARAGRWSAAHRKTAIFGWLAFVVVAFMIGGALGTKNIDQYHGGTGESGRADQRTLAPSDYWDSHSLDKQRAYSIVCWIAGSGQDAYDRIAKQGILGKDRLQTCPAEYQQKVQSVEGLLNKHARG